ncbi:MAG: hypothetical protein J2P57_24590 [Acidimicrobiaceae bacterium]|nr:hypothetical protein [Acidimicrobiaceae bacterium]
MARRAVAALCSVVTLAVVGLAGCGSSSRSASSPSDVQAALRSTANQQGLKLTLTLSGTPGGGNGSSTLTRSQEQAIIDSTLILTVHAASGSTLANAGNGGEVDLALEHGLSTLGDIRVIGHTLYGKVDIPQFTSTYGLNKGSVARFQSELDRLGSQVQGLTALNDGKWVSVDLNSLDTLLAAAGITLPSVPQLVGRIVGAAFNSLAATAHVDQVHGGQAQLTVGARPVVTALARAISGTPGMRSFGTQIQNLAQDAQNSVPANANGKVNATISGGKISNLELPVKQFERNPTSGGPDTVKLAVTSAGSVSAPSGATVLNVAQLIRALVG